MKRNFFYISIGFNVLFMVYAAIEVTVGGGASPSALFFLFMPTLFIGFAYDNPFVTSKVRKMMFVTNTFIFSVISIVLVILLFTGNRTLGELGLATESFMLLLILGMVLMMLVILALSIVSFFIAFKYYPMKTRILMLVALVLLTIDAIVSSELVLNSPSVFQMIIMYLMVGVQGANIYLLYKEW